LSGCKRTVQNCKELNRISKGEIQMKMNDAFPSKWLSANDIDEDLVVTISGDDPVSYEDFKTQGKDTPDRKPVLRFKAPKGTKPMVLNKTNWKVIGQVLGSEDTDDWAGQSITLYATEVEAFGETTMGIRVRAQKPKAVKPAPTVTKSSKSQARQEPADEPQTDDNQNDKDLPF
jgi:hypothetical protein